MTEIMHVDPSISDEELKLIPVANGILNDGSNRSICVFLIRKGGGMMVEVDGKRENRFAISLDELVNFTVDQVIPHFMASEMAVAAEGEPSDVGVAAFTPDAPWLTKEDGPATHTPTVEPTGEASAPFTSDENPDGPQG